MKSRLLRSERDTVSVVTIAQYFPTSTSVGDTRVTEVVEGRVNRRGKSNVVYAFPYYSYRKVPLEHEVKTMICGKSGKLR